MPSPFNSFFSQFRRQRVKPTETLGAAGTPIYGGFIHSVEESSDLQGEKRYKTFSEMLANVSIVAAGVRFFLNLTAKAKWSFRPSEADTDGRFAELAEQILIDDPETSWHRIVRRAAMYRFYGFSVQEWTAMRREDGVVTLQDVAPRAQRSIQKWDVNERGQVLGMLQQSPQTSREIYLPRQKVLYLVDDTLSDSPEGLGLFRHLVVPAKRLRRYEQLEGYGFETDLRGVPIGHGPFSRLAELETAGKLTAAQRIAIEKPIRDFIKNHIKGPALGLLLDSAPYAGQDDAARPSPNKQWSIDLLKSGATSLEANANAIQRVNRELARILGVEQLLLGEGSSGSFALSRDKTQSFFLIVESTLTELVSSIRDDLLKTVWRLNGWDHKFMPNMGNEAIRFQDVEQIASTLRDMALAGAILPPDDPAIGEVRDLLGLSRGDIEGSNMDAALIGRESEDQL